MSKKLTAQAILKDYKRIAEDIGASPSRDAYFGRGGKYSKYEIEQVFGNWTKFILAAGAAKVLDYVDEGSGPKVLFIDIETAPGEFYAFDPRCDYLARPMMKQDITMLSWAARWLDSKEIFYKDLSKQKDKRDAASILPPLWELIDQADIIIGQNSDRFDIPKIQGWFVHHKIKDRFPVSSFKKVDTYKIVKKHFGFTYRSLEHLCEYLGVKHKKLKHERFPGIEIQKECLKGNTQAWADLKEYNINDIHCLVDCWEVMRAWDSSINYNLYTGAKQSVCRQPGCGGALQRNGFYYTSAGKFQRYRCEKCGSEARSRENILSKGKRNALRIGTAR